MDRALRTIIGERTSDGRRAKREFESRPRPAKGKFPYRHRTVAEMDALEAKG